MEAHSDDTVRQALIRALKLPMKEPDGVRRVAIAGFELAIHCGEVELSHLDDPSQESFVSDVELGELLGDSVAYVETADGRSGFFVHRLVERLVRAARANEPVRQALVRAIDDDPRGAHDLTVDGLAVRIHARRVTLHDDRDPTREVYLEDLKLKDLIS